MTTDEQLQRLYDELGALRCEAEISEAIIEITLVEDEFYSIIVTYILRSIASFQSCDTPTETAIRRAGFDWEFDGTEVDLRGPPFFRGLFFYVPGERGKKLEAIRVDDESRARRIQKTLQIGSPRADAVQLRDGVQRVRRKVVH